MKKTLLLLGFLIIGLNSCTSDNDFEKGKKQLENQGYTNIVNTGYNAFCCSNEDSFSTGFEAKDKNGNEVEGCFCSSVFKGVTVRFD